MLCELWLGSKYLRSGKKEKIISITAFIAIAGIAIGVFVLILVIAVMTGFDLFLQDKMVGTNAHLVMEFRRPEKEPYALVEKLKSVPHVVAASPFIAGQAFIKTGGQIISPELRGIDTELQPEVTRIEEYIKEGSLSLEGNEVVMGEELAFGLGLKVGDKIGLISPVSLANTDFRVRGIFKSGMYTYDSGLMLTSLKGAQDFFKTDVLAGGIGIKVDDIYKVDKVRQEIYKSLGYDGFEIRTWADINRNFLNALKLEKTVMFIVVTMTTVVAAFGIVSTLIMSVMSRIKDIGILRSVGAKAGSILQIFVFQGLILGVAGIVLGAATGVWAARFLNSIVDFISRLIGRRLIPAEIYYFDRIPTNITSGDVTVIVACALVISLLASVYPAYYATRINPSEAVRHE